MRPDIEAVAALSPMQQGLLFHSLLDPGAGVYVNQHVISLRGALDAEAFAQAWRTIVGRHQIFRASFHWEEVETALMAIWRTAPLEIDLHDWRAHDRAGQERRLTAFLVRDKARGFVLTTAPLMRVTLFRRSDDEWWCCWCNHHLVLDGWSAALVAREAFVAYAALREGRSMDLPVAPPFTDYLAWLQRQDLAAAEAFWRRELSDLRAGTAIATAMASDIVSDVEVVEFVDVVDVVEAAPAARDAGAERAERVERVERVERAERAAAPGAAIYGQQQLRLSTDETRALQRLARQQGTTLSVIAQAAWAIVLSQYMREPDIVFGVTSSGRPPDLPDVESMAGLFINTLPLRLRVGREQPVAALLARTHEQNLRVRAVEYSPLASVQAWSGLPAGSPLFDSILVFENYPIDRLLTQTVAGLSIEDIRIDEATNYPLSVTIGPGAELLLQITFESARFTAMRIARLLRHYRAALLACAAAPDQRIGDVCLLDEDERAQVRAASQGPRVEMPAESCLHHWIEQQAARTPRAAAVRFGETELSYAALNARANRLAWALIDEGVGRGVLVGVAMERSLELVVALLAILKAGGAYVPLDPEHPRERLAFQIADAAAPVVLTHARFVALLGETRAGTKVLTLDADGQAEVAPSDVARRDAAPPDAVPPDVVPSDAAIEDGMFSGRSANPVCEIRPDDPAYVIYTSGSTGRPKGVVNTHRAICNRLIWMQRAFPLDASDRVLQKTPYSFDVSVWEFFWPLMTGATLVVARPGGHRDAAYVADLIAGERITTIHFVPPMLDALLDEPRFERCVSLTRVICSGEALTWDVQQRFFERSRAALHNLYGPTEAAVDVTWWPCAPEPQRTAVPIGRPIDKIEILLLTDDCRPVPIGVAGELWIGGVGLAQGYWRRPALTAERFAPHPFSHEPGARLYRTGDLARYREDGAIEYLGRLDHQVKIRGFRIELGEIEAALVAHAAVRQCIVVAQPETEAERAAGAGRRLVAYVVTEDRTDSAGVLPIEELRAHLGRTLPSYMVPELFVPLDALPLTHNGKVDRRALPAPQSAAPMPRETAVEAVPPRTPLEEALLACWREVLQRPSIGVTQSFFDLGGHSLLATRLVSRIRSHLRVDLPLRALLDAPTIERLARVIAGLTAGRVPERALVRVPRDRDLPLSLAQERMWYVCRLDATGAAYNMPLAFALDGELDAEALENSLRTLVHRHEPLRTAFATGDDGRPVQRVHADAPFHVERIDLARLAEPEQTARLASVVARTVGTAFDLGQAPLLRATLIALGAARYRLVLLLHHLIADGSSLDLLARELTVCYAAFLRGAAPALPDLPCQYVDYAQRERGEASAEVRPPALEEWVAALRDVPRLALPYDRARPALQTFRGGVVSNIVAEAIVARLQAIGAAGEASPFATWLSAFQILLARVTGQQDICVGTPVGSGRTPDLDGVVGLFVNTVALRTRIGLDASFRASLAKTRETVLHALERAYVPFERIVDALGLDRDPARLPLIDVMFLAGESSPVEQLRFEHLRVRSVEVPAGSAKFDLLVACQPAPGGWRVSWHYNADLFDASTMTGLADAFCELLGALANDPDGAVRMHGLLPAVERARLLEAWAGHSVALPAPALVHRLFERQARERPSALAVSASDARLTYAELDRRATRIAAALAAAGVGVGDRVALSVERSPAQIAALLGILKIGAAYVPLDAAWPAASVRHLLEDIGARVLVVDDAASGRLGAEAVGIGDACIGDEGIGDAGVGEGLKALTIRHAAPSAVGGDDGNRGGNGNGDGRPGAAAVRDADLAYVSYTSGSTGTPKGVAVTHRAIVRLVTGQRYAGLGEGRRVLVGAPLAFDASTFEIWGPLLSGGACVLLPPGVPAPADLRLAIARDRADTAWLTAALFNALVDEAPDAFAGLRQVLTGGEALSVRHVRAFRAAHPGCRLVNGYGPTESTTFATWYDVPDAAALSQADMARIPIGWPLANTRTYVLDASMMPLPIGAIGELYLGGDGLARGYWNRPELTADCFVPDPFARAPGERLYRTGDLVRWRSDGVLDFIGRADDQVKIRGHRIEPAEVEHALRACAGVQAAVVCVDRHAAGARLVACFVPETLAADAVRRELESRLPAYMVPSAFVGLARLPVTAQGKVDRRRLPMPADAAPSATRSRAPSTAMEEAIARIWRDVLGVAAIGVDDGFFAIGGDSLACLRVCERARSAGFSITLAQMLRHQTVAELAAALESVADAAAASGASAPPRVAPGVAPRAVQGAGSAIDRPEAGSMNRRTVPLTASQQFFFEFAGRDLHHYNLAQMFALRDPLSQPQLEAIVAALSARHEALRLCFRREDEGWRAGLAGLADIDVAGGGAGAVAVVDHSALDDDDLDGALAREAARWQASIDLTRAPLLRLVSIDRGAHRDARLFAVVHHLAADGTSLWLLHDDLRTAVDQVRRHESIRLGSARGDAGWTEWVDRLDAEVRGAAAGAAMDYWLAPSEPPPLAPALTQARRMSPHAAPAVPGLDRMFTPLALLRADAGTLPRDRAAGANMQNTQASERELTATWGDAQSRALLRMAAGDGLEIGHLLLAAVARIVSAWTGQEGALIDWIAHGREPLFEDLDVSRTVGYFSTRTPIWVPAGGDTLNALAREARDHLRRLPLGTVGFGLLRYQHPDAAIRRQMAALPRPEISVNYLGRHGRHYDALSAAARAPDALTATSDPIGPSRAATQQRPRLIRVLADVADGCLRVVWKFSANVHDASTIERLAAGVSQSLERVVKTSAAAGGGAAVTSSAEPARGAPEANVIPN